MDIFSYCAGYIDGDGHFRFREYTQEGYQCFHCKLMITSVDESPLRFFKERFGGSYYQKKVVKPNWKPDFLYTLHVGKDSYTHIERIGEYLLDKRPQFELIKPFLYGTANQKRCILGEIKILRESDKVSYESINSLRENKIREFLSSQKMGYLAGIIDSECCLRISRQKLVPTGTYSYSSHLWCSNTRMPILEFLYRHVGGSLHFHDPQKPNYSPYGEWHIGNKALDPILEAVYPFLINKREQCRLIMAFRETFKDAPEVRSKEFIVHQSHVLPIRHQFYLNLKALNKRGL